MEGAEPGLGQLETRPENAAVLDRLRQAAGPARSEYRLGRYEQHAHPDLCERLDDVAQGGRSVEVFGLCGRVSRRWLLYAVAIGTSGLLLRLSGGPARASVIANGGTPATDYGPDWVLADAWLSDVPRAAGTALLTSWLDAAREGAGT